MALTNGVEDTTTATTQPQPYQADKAQAQTWDVGQNQLVQNQVSNIVAQDSPLMQQAAGQAKQQMAGRGLLNSSMAVGAAQNAVIANALPMAQQDAATFANAGQVNAQNQTNVNLQNANAQNQMNVNAQSNDYQLAQMAKTQQYTQANTQLEYQLDTAQKTALANLSTQSAERLAQIEAQYKNLNQTSQSATSIMNTTMQAIASIMQDSSLDATAKQKAIDIYNANAETSLNLIAALAGDVELDDFFARLGA